MEWVEVRGVKIDWWMWGGKKKWKLGSGEAESEGW